MDFPPSLSRRVRFEKITGRIRVLPAEFRIDDEEVVRWLFLQRVSAGEPRAAYVEKHHAPL